jgi:hypothetical protein
LQEVPSLAANFIIPARASLANGQELTACVRVICDQSGECSCELERIWFCGQSYSATGSTEDSARLAGVMDLPPTDIYPIRWYSQIVIEGHPEANAGEEILYE